MEKKQNPDRFFSVKLYRDQAERHRDLADAAEAAGGSLVALWHRERAVAHSLRSRPLKGDDAR
jgi:hypothetical protein